MASCLSRCSRRPLFDTKTSDSRVRVFVGCVHQASSKLPLFSKIFQAANEKVLDSFALAVRLYMASLTTSRTLSRSITTQLPPPFTSSYLFTSSLYLLASCWSRISLLLHQLLFPPPSCRSRYRQSLTQINSSQFSIMKYPISITEKNTTGYRKAADGCRSFDELEEAQSPATTHPSALVQLYDGIDRLCQHRCTVARYGNTSNSST